MSTQEFPVLSFSRVKLMLTVAIGLALLLLVGPRSASAALDWQVKTGPSAFCHATDGTFTACPGGVEWSDVTPLFFPEKQSYLYGDQADLDPLRARPDSPVDTFMFMYDECGHTTPLGPNEYYLVFFDNVEKEDGIEKMERYVLHLFSDNTFLFWENNVLQTPERVKVDAHGQRAAVGFGPSPNCPFDHLIVEYEIPLSEAGGNSYSADPLFWSSDPPPEPPGCKDGDIKVPVMVNVLPGVSLTDAQIQEIMSGMNDVLDQAGVCGDFNPDNIVRDFNDGGNNDSNADASEERGLITSCVNELTTTFAGRGYKVLFANDVFGSASRLGRSYHQTGTGGSVTPCSVVRIPGRTTEQMTRTLAHEFGHAMTLGGHRNDDPDNLMAQSGRGSGTTLDEGQRTEVQDGAKTRAKNTEHASWIDAVSDVSQGFIDLWFGSFFAENLTSDLKIAINVTGLFPDTNVNSKFEMLFNTDNNLGTGGTFGSFGGIDKILEISLTGKFPFMAPAGTMTVSLRDVTSDTSTPLIPGSVSRLQGIDDSLDPSASPPENLSDSIHQLLPLPLLGLSAHQVPIGVRATNTDTGEFDEVSFVFEVEGIAPPLPPGIIDNGTVQLGVNPQGHLNVSGGVPSSGTRTRVVGLRFMPTNAEATAPGCLCEGWGVADAITGVRGFANRDVGGVSNLTVLDFKATADTAVSHVRVGNTFEVTHDYHPSASPNLFEVNVKICNISNAVVNPRYRRVMDWDVEPTAFREFVTVVTIQGTERAKNVLFSSDNGFASPNPLAGPSQILFSGDAVDSGPTDHGALFDFGFDPLAPGECVDFKTFYGAAATEAEANIALATVRAEVFSYGQPNVPGGPNLGIPNTFIFAFSAVGGEIVVELDRDKDNVPDDRDNCPLDFNPLQEDNDINGIGDACQVPGLEHSTAAFFQAVADGSTTLDPTPLAVAEEPDLLERLALIVDFRVTAGLTDSAAGLTTNLVNSLVDIALVPPELASEVVDTVLGLVAPPCPSGDLDGNCQIDMNDIRIVMNLIATGGFDPNADINKDGVVNVLDARLLARMCTRLNCAI